MWLLTGDLGFSVLAEFSDRFPERFLNAGVAEQNMMGVAAGLALSGQVVLTYSIANFPVMRCLEQLRNDVCYHNLDVKTVSVGAGLTYGAHGYTHHATEDLAVMRALPNMTVMAPGDPVEARLAVGAMLERPGPCYLRLGKSGEPVVHATDPAFEIGRAIVVRKGDDVALISTGGALNITVEAAALLEAQGVSARVLSMHTVEPLDSSAVASAAAETSLIATIEPHSPVGGLRDAVLAAIPLVAPRILSFSIPREMVARVGSCEHLMSTAGLTSSAIADGVLGRVGAR